MLKRLTSRACAALPEAGQASLCPWSLFPFGTPGRLALLSA
jgi:hypothetical protein